MGDSRFARCLQGGGVAALGGTVSIVNSQIYSNTVQNVHATETLKISHRPDGEITDVLASTLARTTVVESGTCRRDL